MKKNQKILWVGLIIAIMVLSTSMLFAYFTLLKKPVFFRHYIESDIYTSEGDGSKTGHAGKTGHAQLTLKYITNITDDRDVSYVVFEELPEVSFVANNNGSGFMVFHSAQRKGENYGRYSIRTVNLLGTFTDLKENQKDYHLTQASVYMSNGDMIKMDVGEIILYADVTQEKNFDMYSSGSSSDGTGETKYGIDNDVILKEVSSPLLDTISDYMELKVNGINYKDIAEQKYISGSTMTVNTALKNPSDELYQCTYFELKPKLYYTDSEGKTYYSYIYDIQRTYNFNYSYLKILKYLLVRGAI